MSQPSDQYGQPVERPDWAEPVPFKPIEFTPMSEVKVSESWLCDACGSLVGDKEKHRTHHSTPVTH